MGAQSGNVAGLPSFTQTGTGEPLVLLMGLGAAGEKWAPHIDAWSERFRCIAIDNRGFGGTVDDGGPLSVELMAADVARVVDALDLGPVRVAGISMGSAIAQQLMIDRPELVSKAVLVATWSATPPSLGYFFRSVAGIAGHRDPQLLRLLLQQFTWTPEWNDAHADEAERMIDDPAPIPFSTLERQAEACAAFDVSDRLSGVTVPTLVTYGKTDLLIRPQLSQRTAELIPGAEAIAFETGHVHHWEELDVFNKRVLEWLG
ncbi:alpha/beta fold hydrolase [Agromyces aerolatus]|uniref:alpha/beta fold hydrolase n=1 Tax=Agromyces sp. LY-1074 TaxID=3074080 RepID=UPI002863AD3A|nr:MULTISPECIES: alpha/beta hydrolase [unclassified Agromyces]MDR5700898.1 alpha/beta hydrolase [Agromyces sp. LY-1074]MDR5707441.1 alpha/beta hydrolase [Agromyces sp. LY-1358]